MPKRTTLIFCLIFVCLTSFSNCFAAAARTHYYFALMLLNAYEIELDEEQKNKFILGNLQPDIRYLTKQKRSNTHYNNVSIDDILINIENNKLYKAGALAHSFLDMHRSDFLKAYPKRDVIVKIINSSDNLRKNNLQILKLVEDEIIYQKYNQQQLTNVFNSDLYKEETELDNRISKDKLLKWRAIQGYYFSNSPQQIFNKCNVKEKLALNLNKYLSKEVNQTLACELIYKEIKLLAKEEIVVDYVEELLMYLEEILFS